MGRPKKGYAIGTQRVPGVTTVGGRFADSGGLKWWAWEQGWKQRDRGDAFQFMSTADEPMAAGTLCHQMIEAWIHGLDPEDCVIAAIESEPAPLEATVEGARTGFSAFVRWAEQSKLTVKALEEPLYSKEWLYAGTPDAMTWFDGVPTVTDWKTSKGAKVYPDVVVQLAAYRHLLRENEIAWPEGGAVLALDRDYGTFNHREFSGEQLDVGWQQFVAYLECYDRDKELKRIAGR